MQLKLLPMVLDNLKKKTFLCTKSPTNDDGDTDDEDEDEDKINNITPPFHGLDEKVVPTCNEDRLRWLRVQIIGIDAEIDTPFGMRRLTYADHTASGRSLHYIENYITRTILPTYGNTHTTDSYVGNNTTKKAIEASSYIKKCLGGGEEDAILFCGSGSTAVIKRLQEIIGIAIPSILRERVLSCMSIEERWVVFVGPHEHHSNILSWRQSLAEVVEISIDRDGLVDMDALRQQVEFFGNQNRKILGSFSACSNVTGVYTDTRAIARLLHQFGGFACFDFAACGPYKKIDMCSSEADGYDAIVLSVHKFVGGPGTPGILLMNKALYMLGSSAPSTCGGGTVDYVNGFNEKDTLYVKSIEEREMAGTPPIIQTIRAAFAFWIKEYIGYISIEVKEECYIRKALERLLPNPSIWILGNTSSKRQAIMSFLIYPTYSWMYRLNKEHKEGIGPRGENANVGEKPLHGSFVTKLLNDLFGIQARGGCACAGPYGHTLLNIDRPHSLMIRSAIQNGYDGIKPGWTRVSFPYYMSEEEFEFILEAIEFIAAYGQRFLFLYDFNWNTGSWSFKKNYNKVASSSFTRMIVKLSQDHNENQRISVVLIYKEYLAKAKEIACLLPEFPPMVKPPKEVIDLVSFSI